VGVSAQTIRKLFALSGNRCAFPRCTVRIVCEGVPVGEVCHINAANDGGPRFDKAQSDYDRNGFDNLILLCANHHKVVDDDEEAYTVERLRKMKREHEHSTTRLGEEEVSAGSTILISLGQAGGIVTNSMVVGSINNFLGAAELAEEMRKQREARENEGSVEDVLRWALSPRSRERAAASPAAAEPVADMTIQEVFFHIDADVLDSNGWIKVGDELISLLAHGAILASGRQAVFGHGSYYGNPNLTPIEHSYWRTARFTFDWFGADRENDIHVETIPPAEGPVYRDLRFSSAQIRARWPIKSVSQDRIYAMKGIYYILTQSEWAADLARNPDSMPQQWYEQDKPRKEIIRARTLSRLRRDLHDRLRSGEIEAWARKDRHHPLAPISREEWDHIIITTDERDFQNLESGFCTQNTQRGAYRTTIYEGVQFVRSTLFKSYRLLREPFYVTEEGGVVTV
jgi:hypothetical protein